MFKHTFHSQYLIWSTNITEQKRWRQSYSLQILTFILFMIIVYGPYHCPQIIVYGPYPCPQTHVYGPYSFESLIAEIDPGTNSYLWSEWPPLLSFPVLISPPLTKYWCDQPLNLIERKSPRPRSPDTNVSPIPNPPTLVWMYLFLCNFIEFYFFK